jgi:hypothetical protein
MQRIDHGFWKCQYTSCREFAPMVRIPPPEAPPASPLSDERLAEIRWLANTGVEGSVAATELRELLAEVDRLRALTRRNDA